MADVVFLSSVFQQVKIAEPMGVSILTAQLRKRGFEVSILEPSIEGWSVSEAAERIAAAGSPIVAISMLRDKNVDDVLAFVTELRRLRPDVFMVVGGHGPSISLSTIPDKTVVADYLDGQSERYSNAAAPVPAAAHAGQPMLPVIPVFALTSGTLVDSRLTGRGHGAAEPDSCSTALARLPSDTPCSTSGGPAAGRAGLSSTYFDVTAEYLAILEQADTAMVGESDLNFPDLVSRILTGQSWQDCPAVSYVQDGIFHRRPTPPKITDLDGLPFMARDVFDRYQSRYQTDLPASILASRGCYYRCTFCSVVSYERLQEGSAHRQRSNQNVVEEMRVLHDRFGVRRFNFEDDNFVVKNKAGRLRLLDLCRRIRDLPFEAEFTFFCRADVVDRELFQELRSAGLIGIYFGLESVYPGDLEFFHKGLRVEQMFHALELLGDLGFSPSVEAERRIMLGYITWHPLTSFESLRATSAFLRRFAAPPKLLRRKLRVYAGTEVIADVHRLGLLDAGHPDGWRFRDARMQGLEAHVNTVFAAVNRERDRLRTLEKAGSVHGYAVPTAHYAERRRYLDGFLCDTFDDIVGTAEAAGGATRPAVSEAVRTALEKFEEYALVTGLRDEISTGYRACGFDLRVVDLFRK
jgi:hypothetical protein